MTAIPEQEKKKEISEANIEYTIALVKPNGVKTGMVGLLKQELLGERFEIVTETDISINKRQANLIYSHLGEKASCIIDHIISGPSHAFIIRGEDVIRKLRKAVGYTSWKDRPAKGLRSKYAFNFIENTIHAPDSYRESVLEFLNLIPATTERILTQTQLAEEFYNFLTDIKKIEKNERFLNPYCV